MDYLEVQLAILRQRKKSLADKFESLKAKVTSYQAAVEEATILVESAKNALYKCQSGEG